MIDFGNARLGNKPRGARHPELPSDGVPIRVDDALSVNYNFMTSNARERQQVQAQINELTEEPETSWTEGERASHAKLLSKARIMDHRYPDDGESAIYCLAMQLWFACEDPLVKEQYRQKVIETIVDDKITHWNDPTAFDLCWTFCCRMKRGPMSKPAAETIKRAAQAIRTGQQEIRKFGTEQTGELADCEYSALLDLIAAFDEYLHENP